MARLEIDLRTAPVLEGVGDGPQRAAREWEASRLAEVLAAFDPANVSSLASGLGLEASDLDVACDLRRPGFVEVVREAFGDRPGFTIAGHGRLMLVSFQGAELPVELVGEPRPVEEQQAYRHAVAHRRLVQQHGPGFAAEVRAVRAAEDLATEPAIARVLGLAGDPFDAVDGYATGVIPPR